MTWDARNVRLSYLATYPIKSCYRVEADTAEVEPWGLAGDRRWIVVDEAAKLMTQRHWPALGRIRPRSLGQAARIPGLRPGDIQVLLVHIEREKRLSAA